MQGTYEPIYLLSKATSATSKIQTVQNKTDASITVTGTSTSYTLTFWISNDQTEWVPIKGYSSDPDNTSDGISITATAAIKAGFEFDVGNYNYFKVSLDSISNGYVTVVANIVNKL